MKQKLKKTMRFAVGVILLTTQLTVSSAAPAEKVFAWRIRTVPVNDPIDNDYHNVPIAGVLEPAASVNTVYTYNSLYDSGYLMGIMLNGQTAPVNGTKDKTALATVMGYVQRLDYVFADFEIGQSLDEADVLEMVDQVRNSSNQNCRNAYIGNYNWYAGNTDYAARYAADIDRTSKSNDYLSSGLNCAMPDCYPYSYYLDHTGVPNVRSALFWAPLERCSAAKCALPESHQLIPWIAGFVEWTGYESVTPPTREDCRALLQHIRLRGADGYYALNSENPNYLDSDEYYRDMIDAWRDLNDIFAANGVKSILNLTTDKAGGIQWSGIRNENKITILVSNLGNNSSSVIYPDKFDLPAASATVSPGQHRLFNYLISNLIDNGNFDSGTAGWYLCPGKSIWDSTAGINGTGCLKLEGGPNSAVGTQPIYVEPNAKMNISCYAKGQSGANFRMQYYYYDSAGVNLGYSSMHINVVTSGDYQRYESDFTIPDNPAIAYICPIVYNYYADNDPNDIIWIDDMRIKFASSNLIENNDFNSGSSGWNLPQGKSSWDSSAGLNDTGCLKLESGPISASGAQRIYVSPNTTMNISCYAKGQNSAHFGVQYYYYNSAGTYLGYSSAHIYVATSSDFQKYESNFTIPDNPDIAYIYPILYNYDGANDPSAIIWVDNIAIKPLNLLENGDFNLSSTGWYLSQGKSSLDLSAGLGGTGCLKLESGPISASGTQPIYVEPDMSMHISCYAKGQNNAQFGVQYYYYSAAGVNLGYSSAHIYVATSSSYQKYESNFTIPDNPNIAYICPILYNYDGAADPNAVIWVDNISILKND